MTFKIRYYSIVEWRNVKSGRQFRAEVPNATFERFWNALCDKRDSHDVTIVRCAHTHDYVKVG